jgi:hypothetical protein
LIAVQPADASALSLDPSVTAPSTALEISSVRVIAPVVPRAAKSRRRFNDSPNT